MTPPVSETSHVPDRPMDPDLFIPSGDSVLELAAVTVSRPGADPPWRHELEAPG